MKNERLKYSVSTLCNALVKLVDMVAAKMKVY
jgi:hypothetical protein